MALVAAAVSLLPPLMESDSVAEEDEDEDPSTSSLGLERSAISANRKERKVV